MTHGRGRGALWVAATAMVLLGGGARAQSPGVTTTLIGGWSLDRDITPGIEPGTVLEDGWLAGLQADFYPGGGALGIRLSGFFSPKDLQDTDPVARYDLVTADVGFTFRLLPVESLGSMIPYLALTAGGTRFQSRNDAPAFGDGAFGADPVYRFHATASLGLDIPLIHPLALRVEGGDRVIFPSVGDSPEVKGFPTVHTPVILVGLQTRFAMPPRRRPARRAPPVDETPAVVAEREAVQAERDTVGAGVREPMAEQPVDVAAPAAADAPAFTVQVESFLGRSTARRWAQRAEGEGLPAWTLDVDLAGTPASRLRIGAAATEQEAVRLAAAVEQEFGWTVTVQRITGGEALPTNVLQLTRDFLAGR